ncbi:hypothetical protein D8S78_06925 [Natrialba swarupiae]|nr:hypothetical protein [Natrialba swarupiae]
MELFVGAIGGESWWCGNNLQGPVVVIAVRSRAVIRLVVLFDSHSDILERDQPLRSRFEGRRQVRVTRPRHAGLDRRPGRRSRGTSSTTGETSPSRSFSATRWPIPPSSGRW